MRGTFTPNSLPAFTGAFDLTPFQVKDTAINQARRMELDLQNQYRYVAPLKKKVLGVLDGIGELTLIQRNTIVGFVDQFLT